MQAGAEVNVVAITLQPVVREDEAVEQLVEVPDAQSTQ